MDNLSDNHDGMDLDAASSYGNGHHNFEDHPELDMHELPDADMTGYTTYCSNCNGIKLPGEGGDCPDCGKHIYKQTVKGTSDEFNR